jgi:hypothetical protein
MRFRLFSYHTDYLQPDEDEEETPASIDTVNTFRPPIIELAPLRLFVQGLSQPQSTGAFLQFFRVLEYFCLFPYEERIEALRQRTDLGTREFLIELQTVLFRDEKSLICGLVGKLTDTSLIKQARRANLISQENAGAFCTALYDFRNSLVHAKSDRPAAIFTESLFLQDESAAAWRAICEELAYRALEQHAKRAAPN